MVSVVGGEARWYIQAIISKKEQATMVKNPRNERNKEGGEGGEIPHFHHCIEMRE